VRRQVHQARPETAGRAADAERECPGGGVHEFRCAAGELVADELLDSAAALWRVNGDVCLLFPTSGKVAEVPPQVRSSLLTAQ
jgi:hypothetical protein